MPAFARAQKQAQSSHLVRPIKPDGVTFGPVRTTDSLLAQQQALGNQAMLRFAQSCPLSLPGTSIFPFGSVCHTCPERVQTKLKISQPGDKYEQEADSVANQVVRMPEPGKPSELKGISAVHSQTDCGKFSQHLIENRSPLLTDADNPECLPAKLIQRETTTDESEGVGRPLHGEEEEELVLMTKAIKAPHSAPHTTPKSINNALNAIHHTNGEPLHLGLRSFFEPRFDHDFGQVRIHTGTHATRLAQTLNARALTNGNNIVFDNREYNPNTQRGLHLIAHELTHTIQQTGGTPHITRKRTQPGVIQRAQIGHINRPTTGTPYFMYELDAAVPNFTMLATYYGVNASDIVAMNAGVSLRVGTRVNVPAFNPPTAMTGSFGGTGRANIVTGSNVNVRWTPNIGSNKLGQLNNGNTIPEVFSTGHGLYSSAFIDPLQLAHRADGIINELMHLNLVTGPASIGNYVLAHVPTANITQRTVRAQNALRYAVDEHAAGVVESPPCTNRGPQVDRYTGVTGANPVISREEDGRRLLGGVCGRAWCAYFVKWCLDQAGVSNAVTGAAVSVKRWGESQRWYHLIPSITPMQGDIFFKPPSGGGAHPCDTNPCVSRGPGTGHVGFVTSVSGTNVQTVEGNVHDSAPNDGIRTLTRPLRDLDGVVRIP